jgi:hypothetical protein
LKSVNLESICMGGSPESKKRPHRSRCERR